MNRHSLISHQRPISSVWHQSCSVGNETSEDARKSSLRFCFRRTRFWGFSGSQKLELRALLEELFLDILGMLVSSSIAYMEPNQTLEKGLEPTSRY